MKSELWAPQIFIPQGFAKTDMLVGAKALDVGCSIFGIPHTIARRVEHGVAAFPRWAGIGCMLEFRHARAPLGTV